WLDPMCGLMLACAVAAALWQRRRHGGVARIDFSMIEAMLWTMAEPLLQTQCGAPPLPRGNRSDRHKVHDAYRCGGEDAWIGVAVENEAEWQNLCAVLGGKPLADWLRGRDAYEAEYALRGAGIAAAALASASDLVASEHLRARGFWDVHRDGVLPGLPWRASFARQSGEAPALGADTDFVLAEVLGLSISEIGKLRKLGAVL
ncbi:MAG TPA: CoA transferase, partial [Acetobacteraceae bacterium]